MLVTYIINHPTCTINRLPITVVTPISQIFFHYLISSQIYEFFLKIWKRPLKYPLKCNTTHSHSSHMQIYTIFVDSVTGWQSVRHGEPKQRDSKYQHIFYSQKILNRYLTHFEPNTETHCRPTSDSPSTTPPGSPRLKQDQTRAKRTKKVRATRDSNPQPPAPKAGVLPLELATPRCCLVGK